MLPFYIILHLKNKINETKKILTAPNISISATAVRIPVFISHSESVNIQTETKLTRDDVIALLEKAPGVSVMDDPENNEFPTHHLTHLLYFWVPEF